MGGYARIKTVVDEKRNTGGNVLTLDAGDQFMGTLWSVLFQDSMAGKFMDLISFDAMTLGNHEFDYPVENLASFVDEIKDSTAVISCNIQLDTGHILEDKININAKGYTIKEYGDVKVAVIGATTPDTKILTNPHHTEGITFLSVESSVRAVVDELEAQGINIFIALTHQGYELDLRLAAAVPKLDIIVGGHSHTFLYDMDEPQPTWAVDGGNSFGGDEVEGPYPTRVPVASGTKEVLIVHAFTASRYVGHLTATFDGNGEVISSNGNPIPLFGNLPPQASAFNAIQEDSEMKALIAPGLVEIEARSFEKVGEAAVLLEGSRESESTYGNYVTEALIVYCNANINLPRDVQIAVQNAGGIRASIAEGNVTFGDLAVAHPFGNVIAVVEVTGKTLYGILENGVGHGAGGRFPQVGGLSFVWESAKPPGGRVQAAFLADGTRIENDESTTYMVACDNYVLAGGDGYDFDLESDMTVLHVESGPALLGALVSYFQDHSPVSASTDGRIWDCTGTYNRHTEPKHGSCSPTPAASPDDLESDLESTRHQPEEQGNGLSSDQVRKIVAGAAVGIIVVGAILVYVAGLYFARRRAQKSALEGDVEAGNPK